MSAADTSVARITRSVRRRARLARLVEMYELAPNEDYDQEALFAVLRDERECDRYALVLADDGQTLIVLHRTIGAALHDAEQAPQSSYPKRCDGLVDLETGRWFAVGMRAELGGVRGLIEPAANGGRETGED